MKTFVETKLADIHVRPNRSLDINERVSVYRNTHKNCYSIKQGNVVVAYADKLFLRQTTFKVNQTGRNRVIESERKNPHAWINGLICSLEFSQKGRQITYNPYLYKEFVYKRTKRPCRPGGIVWLKPEGVFEVMNNFNLVKP